ncbi:MAG: threonine/serine dehydratase [Anaerolineae bacterium]|jgi:threonine dehydratase
MRLPTFQDVLLARRTIAPHLRPTPLYFYWGLSELVGAEVWVKHENHQPVGAFKVRGGVNLVAHMDDEERARGVISASTGNHGQSIAYAARLFGVRAIIGMPQGSNPGKIAAIRNLGAEIHFHGRDFDEARLYVEELAEREGLRYVSSGDEPRLIAGVGTYALEIIEALPDVAAIVVPVGGGSGAAGVCTVVKSVNPDIRVIGVQAEKAPSAYLSWKEERRVEAKMETFAEGLATRAPFDLPQAVLRRHLDDFVLVGEAELREAVLLMLTHTHNLAEGAGAAALAGALKLKEGLAGAKVALVQSGGNLSLARLREILGEGA